MTAQEHIHDKLAAYLGGELDARASEAIGIHLKSCDACRKEFESFAALWNSLGNLPEEQPSARLHDRFYAALEAYESSLQETVRSAPVAKSARSWFGRIFPKQYALQFAVVILCIVLGGIIGYEMRKDNVSSGELSQLRDEVRSVSRLLTVSLLQQQSASERLHGVSWSYRIENADPEITEALLQVLRQDANVNVRLAALDAISRNMQQPNVRTELLKALQTQSSPMVQIAIIDLMVQTREKESTDALKQLLQKPGVNEDVKKRIQQSIQQLES